MRSHRLTVALGVTLLLVATRADAHCDTLDGPVVSAARGALESGELAPVLRWVPAEAEAEVATAFAGARQVRSLSTEARELADRWFFETVVRLHRAGEGEPYTGLSPRAAAVDPMIAAVDEALRSGTPDDLLERLATQVGAAARDRWARLLHAQRQDDGSVPRGREVVAAYVDLLHFVERLESVVAATAVTHGHTPEPAPLPHHRGAFENP